MSRAANQPRMALVGENQQDFRAITLRIGRFEEGVKEVCYQAFREFRSAIPQREQQPISLLARQLCPAGKSPEPPSLAPCRGSTTSCTPPSQPSQQHHARNSCRHARWKQPRSSDDAHGSGNNPSCSTRPSQPTKRSSPAAHKSAPPPAGTRTRQSTANSCNEAGTYLTN